MARYFSTAGKTHEGQFDFRSGNNFDLLRFAFASLVVLSHAWPIARGPNTEDPLGRIAPGRSLGEVAVDAFFVISGFLIAGSWLHSRGLLDFLKKRVLRIYPAFLVLSFLQAFVLTPLLAEGVVHPYTLRQLGLIAFEMVDLVSYGFPYGGLYHVLSHNPFHELNGALWSIRYEFVCYLFVALLGLLGLLRRPGVVAALFVAVLGFHVGGFAIPWCRWLTALLGAAPPWPRLLTYYLAGTAFYLNREKIPYSSFFATFCVVMLGAGVMVPSWFDALLPTFGTYLLFWVAARRGRTNHFGRSGDFSYGVYLYGFPIQQLVVWRLGGTAPLAVLFLWAWGLAIVAGIASWHLVEKRFLRRSTIARDNSPVVANVEAEGRAGGSEPAAASTPAGDALTPPAIP